MNTISSKLWEQAVGTRLLTSGQVFTSTSEGPGSQSLELGRSSGCHGPRWRKLVSLSHAMLDEDRAQWFEVKPWHKEFAQPQ